MKKNKLQTFVKKNTLLRTSFYFFDALIRQLRFNIFSFTHALFWYFKDYVNFAQSRKNPKAPLSLDTLLPQLADKTSHTPLDHIYILQNAWACQKLFTYKPKKHIDIGSSIGAVAIMSQFVPTTMVDIRSVDIKLKGLTFTEGSILDLPFKNNSVASLSSICVVEHIGLGRYGDPINPFGTEESLAEIQRVMKKNGDILLSVPVGKKNRVLFNAHREFIPKEFVAMLPDCKLISVEYIVGNSIKQKFSAQDDNVVGLFHFRKK